MNIIKEFFKPNKWKVGLFMILSFLLLYTTLVEFIPGCEVNNGISISCKDSVLESVLRMGQWPAFFSFFLLVPMLIPIRLIPMVLPFSKPLFGPGLPPYLVFLVYSYLFSCFVYFITSKVKNRRKKLDG